MVGKNVFNSVLECIGHTPLVKINRLNPNSKVTVYAKLESKNPGGSIKDRVALTMIEEAERKGVLTKDKIIIEATSGNTGIGLAMVAAVKGYRVILAMPETASTERQKILRAFGAQILLTPGTLGTDGAIEEVYRLVRENPDLYFMPDQFNNPANPLAHYLGTGPEIYEQTDGKVNVVVVTLGTSGTAMGILKAMKERNPDIEVVAVEPYPGHKIQGLKNMKESYIPGIFDRYALDRIVHVRDEEAFEMARKLAREEGIFAGMSSGAAMAVAIRMAQEREDGIIVAVLPDGGDRYLSTNLFTVMLEPDFRFFDQLTMKLKQLKPVEEGKIRLFITGPPLDGSLTINESRRFFVADLLVRFLEAKGFSTLAVMTVPDLDSRTIQMLDHAGKDFESFVKEKLQDLFDLFDRFNIKRPYRCARVSEYTDVIVDKVQELIDKGFAYEKLRSVYFNICRFSDYGKLAHIDPRETVPGKRIDPSLFEKQNPRDFALLKRASLNELKRGLYMKARWGNVIPTWHIAASTILLSQWGTPVDIYLSGADFLFPHLENVRVVGEALAGKPVAQVWLVCERLWVRKKASSDEFDETTTLYDLLNEGFRPEEVRFWLLSAHYRKPLHASRSGLANAVKSFRRLRRFVAALHLPPVKSGESNSRFSDLLYKLEREFFDALSEDINTPKALSALFAFVREANAIMQESGISEEDRQNTLNLLKKLDAVLGILGKDLVPPEPIIIELLKRRETARLNGNWDEADRLRQELEDKGIRIYDTPAGTRWERVD